MKAMHLAAVLLVATAAVAQSSTSSSDAQVRINQIQVIGSHNSYHAGLLPGMRAFLTKEKPDSLRGLDYAHQPLDKQFDGGVRQIELDIFADSKGGRYA
ncbi:MAG: Ca2+-dependent phosphoinositide-specific phospholipase C, partial [Acidobacteriaceae bacterium]